MTPVLVALIAAGAVLAVGRQVAPPPRRLGPRVRPYTAWSRSRLGTGYADPVVATTLPAREVGPVRALVEPLIKTMATRLARLVELGDDDTLQCRLRQAGWRDLEPVRWRRRQLAWLTGGLVMATVLISALGLGVRSGPVVAVGIVFPAATRERNRLARAIELRRSRMRSELYTVAQLVAVRVRTGHGPVDAVRAVAALGRGPVVEELSEGLGWIARGAAPRQAWTELATQTAEPMVGRLHRLLASSSRSGGDVTGALLALADDVRSARRDEMARQAVTRRTAMLLPLLGLIAPVMLLFVAAAIPSIVFGVR